MNEKLKYREKQTDGNRDIHEIKERESEREGEGQREREGGRKGERRTTSERLQHTYMHSGRERTYIYRNREQFENKFE